MTDMIEKSEMDKNEKRRGDILKVLVAEDEVLLAKAIVKILKTNGYMTEAVYNGPDALRSIESGEYDIAVLDVMMPGMDGVTVTAKIRERGIHMPILLLTARTEIQDKVAGLDGGASYYMTKPFDTKELLAVVRSLARRQAVDAAKLYCGNITLDRDEMELSSPTGSYRLSKKEYLVMEMLMMAFGHGIRKNRILEKLWQTEAGAVSDIITVYTSYLSQKLKALQATIAIDMMGDKYCLQEVENEI